MFLLTDKGITSTELGVTIIVEKVPVIRIVDIVRKLNRMIFRSGNVVKQTKNGDLLLIVLISKAGVVTVQPDWLEVLIFIVFPDGN